LNIMDKVELKDETAILPNPCYVQCGDNLELLKSQPNESVNMIYCDILYGTGRNFGDYQDLKPIRSEIESHYLPRLIEMKRVLKQNGSIYLQMDTRINHWMRILMDEIFGYENFRNEIVWNVEYRLKQQTRKFTEFGERILFYTKSNDYIFYPPQVKHKTSKEHQERCRNTPSVKNGKFKTPFRETKNAGDVWNDIKSLTYKSKENTGYNTQKPKELISRFVLASTNEGDLVADYYLGSGTTAKVCQELNRKFIGCDLNPKAIEITKARLNGGQ